MYFLIIQLKDERYQEDLLLAMTDAGIHNAIILNAVDMSSTMAVDIPIFAGFREEFGKRRAYNKVIWATTDDESAPEKVLEILKQSDVDFLGKSLGKIFLIPIAKIYESEE